MYFMNAELLRMIGSHQSFNPDSRDPVSKQTFIHRLEPNNHTTQTHSQTEKRNMSRQIEAETCYNNS